MASGNWGSETEGFFISLFPWPQPIGAKRSSVACSLSFHLATPLGIKGCTRELLKLRRHPAQDFCRIRAVLKGCRFTEVNTDASECGPWPDRARRNDPGSSDEPNADYCSPASRDDHRHTRHQRLRLARFA